MADGKLQLSIALRLENKAIKAGLDEAQRDFNRLFAGLEAGARKAGAAGGLNIRLNKAILDDIAAVRASYAALATSADVSGAEMVRAGQAARQKIADLNAEMHGTAAGGGNAFAASLARVGHTMSLMFLGAVSLRNAISGIQDTLKTGEAFTNLGTTLKFATGSTAQAAAEMGFLRQTAESLGLPLLEAGKSYASLAAATKGTAVEGEGTRKVFLGVASAARVMGLSNEDLKGALLAVAQMASKGTVQAEELRGQLGERIPGAFKLAAQAMGVTEVEFNKLLDTGQVLASDFLPKFGALMLRTFGEDATDAAHTFSAEMNRLKNQFADVLDELSRAGVMRTFVDLVKSASDELKRLGETGELQASLKQVAEAISTSVNALATGAKFAADHWRDLVAVIAGLVGGRTLFAAAEAFAEMRTGLVAVGGAAVLAEKAILAINAAIVALPATIVIGVTLAITKKITDAADAAKADFANAGAISNKGAARSEAAMAEIENALLDKARAVRVAAETAHAGNLKKIKDAELAYIKQVLDAQVKAYDEANKGLAAARKKREDIEKANRDFMAKVKAGPAQAKGEITPLDVAGDTASAREAIQKKDYDAAGKSIDAAREKILAMKDAGIEAEKALKAATTAEEEDAARMQLRAAQAPVVLAELARQVNELSLQVGKAEESAAQTQVNDIQKAIQDTVNKAEWLNHITVGFDKDGAIKNADDLRAAIEARLAKNPIVVPINYAVLQGASQDGRIDPLLGIEKKAAGGLITGPGSDTSDNLLARLSPGEFVMRAAAVRQWGANRLTALNAGRMPGFASGSLVTRAVSALPAFANGGLVAGGGMQPINITLPGLGTWPMQAAPGVAQDFAAVLRREAMKRG